MVLYSEIHRYYVGRYYNGGRTFEEVIQMKILKLEKYFFLIPIDSFGLIDLFFARNL